MVAISRELLSQATISLQNQTEETRGAEEKLRQERMSFIKTLNGITIIDDSCFEIFQELGSVNKKIPEISPEIFFALLLRSILFTATVEKFIFHRRNDHKKGNLTDEYSAKVNTEDISIKVDFDEMKVKISTRLRAENGWATDQHIFTFSLLAITVWAGLESHETLLCEEYEYHRDHEDAEFSQYQKKEQFSLLENPRDLHAFLVVMKILGLHINEQKVATKK